MAMIAGMPPATDAPNSSCRPIFWASSSNSGPWSAMRSLFAVTTDFPDRRALRIQSPAGSIPPTNSRMISASEESTSSMSSVQIIWRGRPSIFLRLMLRLKMCVKTNGLSGSWQRILATERPTVPKPSRATRVFLAAGDFFGAGRALLRDFGRLGTAMSPQVCLIQDCAGIVRTARWPILGSRTESVRSGNGQRKLRDYNIFGPAVSEERSRGANNDQQKPLGLLEAGVTKWRCGVVRSRVSLTERGSRGRLPSG